jgi:hypothetical protein
MQLRLDSHITYHSMPFDLQFYNYVEHTTEANINNINNTNMKS